MNELPDCYNLYVYTINVHAKKKQHIRVTDILKFNINATFHDVTTGPDIPLPILKYLFIHI